MDTLLQYGRKRFRDFLHQTFELTGDIILDRIYNYFNTGSQFTIGLTGLVCSYLMGKANCVARYKETCSMKTFKILLTTSMWRSG